MFRLTSPPMRKSASKRSTVLTAPVMGRLCTPSPTTDFDGDGVPEPENCGTDKGHRGAVELASKISAFAKALGQSDCSPTQRHRRPTIIDKLRNHPIPTGAGRRRHPTSRPRSTPFTMVPRSSPQRAQCRPRRSRSCSRSVRSASRQPMGEDERQQVHGCARHVNNGASFGVTVTRGRVMARGRLRNPDARRLHRLELPHHRQQRHRQ